MAKAAWRKRIYTTRRALSAEVRTARAAALGAAAVALADEVGGPVCAFVPVGTEPWSPDGVEALRVAGHEVLLPVVPGRAVPLDWARFDGLDALAPGPIGLREPAGPRLSPAAIARARLVLVPGLAVDRCGVRLGRGGGYYDRSLPLATPGVPLVVVLNDEELVDALPAEPHDRPVSAVLLAEAGVTAVGNKKAGNKK